jgi:DNA-binding response OmpR family regulator
MIGRVPTVLIPGLIAAEHIRSWSSVPIIILSVKSSEIEKVRLFDLRADDYVTGCLACAPHLRARSVPRPTLARSCGR